MKMKKILATILIVSIVLFGTPAFGLLDHNEDNSILKGATNTATSGNAVVKDNVVEGGAGGAGGDAEGGVAIQGQLGLVGQTNQQGTKVEVGGDEVKTYIMQAPHTSAEKGQSAASAYSLFGGLNLAETEEGEKCIEVIRAVSQAEAANLITHEKAVEIANEMINQLVVTARPKRVLGILWRTNGRHLFNGFGMLATDDAFAALEDMANAAAAKKAAREIIEEINE